MEWLKESWGYLFLILALIGAGFKLLQTSLGAERDRQALKDVELDREKLKLEIARLKNDPAVVADRRAIYERLRLIVALITRDAKVNSQNIYDLHEVIHDAEFRFPPDVVESIRGFLHAAVGLHVSGARLEGGPGGMSTAQWEKQVQINTDVLTKIAGFEQGMVTLFKPHLSL